MGFLPSFIAICTGSPGCANGGTCISPQRCRCMPGWQGAKCRTGMYTVYYTACNASDNRYTLRTPCMETNLQKTLLCVTQFGGTDA